MIEKNPRLGTQVLVRIGIPPNDQEELAHIPPELPLVPPPDLSSMLLLLEQASAALGGLNAIRSTGGGPQMNSLLRIYAQREATFSSQIEGTQTSLQELLLSEDNHDDVKTDQPGDGFAARRDDFRETMNYAAALEYGFEQFLLPEGLPLCLRFLRELHKRLLRGSVRGANKDPGEFRRGQNFIGGGGGVSYVPPPADRMNACLDNFEKQLNDTSPSLPLLVQAAVLHAQFESIHPFLDGNGRVGRLLIVLFLCQRKILHEPSLHLSWYFKNHRDDYFHHLNGIREPGGWEAWIKFFLEGVRDTAREARIRTEKIQFMFTRDRTRIVDLGRKGDTALRIHEVLQQKVFLSAPRAAELTQRSYTPALRALEILEKMDIVREFTGQKRNRVFAYWDYFNLLTEDAETTPRAAPVPSGPPVPPPFPSAPPPRFPSR